MTYINRLISARVDCHDTLNDFHCQCLKTGPGIIKNYPMFSDRNIWETDVDIDQTDP